MKQKSFLMKQKTFLGATAIAMSIGPAAMAATVSIDQIGAVWQNPVFDNPSTANIIDNGNNDPTDGGETVTIFWGDPAGDGDQASPTGQSGYAFNPEDVSFNAPANVPQRLGTFTHFNRPIFAANINRPDAGSLETVDLLFHFAGTPVSPELGSQTSFGAVFNFSHNETTNTLNGLPNIGVCDDDLQETGTPCDDVVTVSAVGGASETVTVGDTNYIFTLLGFSEDGSDGSFSNIFTTEEGLDSSRDLWFEYEVNVIPLPAAGWLLLAGIGGLAAVGRRRKKA